MNLAGIVGILLLCGLSAVLGALGWERYQLRSANTEWAQTVEKVRKANVEIVAAERRLASARTKRNNEGAQLEVATNATSLAGCPVDPAVQRLLSVAADQTRAN